MRSKWILFRCRVLPIVLAAVLGFWLASPAAAADAEAASTELDTAAEGDVDFELEAVSTDEDYDNNPFPDTDGRENPDPGGTMSTANELQEDSRHRRGRIGPSEFSQRWNAYKQQVYEATGVRFGVSYGVLGQVYSNSLIDQDTAISHKFAINITAELVGRESGNVGALNMNVEDRSSWKDGLPPLLAGIPAGSIIPTTSTWSDFGFGITQLYWGQRLFENRIKFDIGRVFAPNYINAFPLFDDNRQFFNLTFTSPTIALPLRGAGGVVNVYLTDNIYARAGVYNANSSDTSSTVGDLFENWETFQNIELGWTGSSRRPASTVASSVTDTNNVHLVIWHKDRQVARDIDESWGVAFNANYLHNNKIMPFVRGGWSDGNATLVDANLTAGIGIRPFDTEADLFGMGVGWAQPSNHILDHQYTMEMFYRYQLSEIVAITPDIQLIINPALTPSKSTLWVGGLRIRATF